MDRFRTTLRGSTACACWGRCPFKAGYLRQLVLQGCGHFWSIFLPSQDGVHCLNVSVAESWYFLPVTFEGRETTTVRNA
jgi:hypothetical protein